MLAESDFDEALRIEHRPAYQIAFGLIEGLSRICEIRATILFLFAFDPGLIAFLIAVSEPPKRITRSRGRILARKSSLTRGNQ
jgi:hypothetical protein